ncbi:MAG: MoaD/ThiS family protein [Anaerolineales bacterium]|nr:MoaD/ThiS family protein [Anaerolineales bacterium]
MRKKESMITLRIPTPLRTYTSGKSEVTVSGAIISEALNDLTNQYPTIKPHLFNDGGDLRPFVNLFVGEHNIKDLQGMNTPVKDGEKIMLIPSIAGGHRHCEEGALPSEVIPNFSWDCFVAKNKCAPRNDELAGGQDAA